MYYDWIVSRLDDCFYDHGAVFDSCCSCGYANDYVYCIYHVNMISRDVYHSHDRCRNRAKNAHDCRIDSISYLGPIDDDDLSCVDEQM